MNNAAGNGAVGAAGVKAVPVAVPATASPPALPSNPFVGPVPLDVGQTLHGRRRETEELSDLLVSKRIALLFSPSGAGKTSLIRAGLIPKLEDAYDMEALPIVRLGHRDAECDNNPSINRYRLATLYALEKLRGEDERRQARDLCGYTLKQYFEECVSAALGRDAEGEPHYPLLILDQFEELFVADPLDVDRKREYLEELGDLLRGATPGRWGGEAGAQIWALFAIREDRLAELQPYLDLIPTALSFRYRLDALGVDAAREAIGETAGPQWMAQDVPPRLVEDLCQVSVRGADGRDTLQPGRFVEPVQLQVVCRRLWTKVVLREGRRIEVGDVTARGLSEVDSALREFFDDEIAAAAEESGVSERTLREWIGTSLISESGVRTQALRDRTQLGQVDEAVTRLVDAHLLRSDSRAGRDWIELPHDRLVAPVLASNKAWEQAHLQPFQVRSRLWHEASGEYARHLLLPAEELAAANRWAADHRGDMNEDEDEFLRTSAEEVARSNRARRDRNLLRGVIGASAVAIIAVVSAWGLVERKQKAQAVKRSALYQTVASTRDMTAPGEALNMLLPLREQADALDKEGNLKRAVDNAIAMQLTRAQAAVIRELAPRDHIVWSVAFSPDGDRVLAGSWDGHISVQNIAVPGSDVYVTPDLRTQTYAVAVHGDLIASSHWDGRVLLWRMDKGKLRQVAVLVPVPNRGRLTTAAFSDDGRWLAASGWGKRVELWDLANPTAPIHVASFGKGGAPVQSIAFLPRGAAQQQRLASTDYDGNVRLWSVGGDQAEPQQPQQEFSIKDHLGREVGISASAADPSGRYFIAGDTEGSLHVWDLASADRTRNGIRLDRASHGGSESPSDRAVKGLAFASGSNDFVSVGVDGYLVRWRLPADASDLADLNRRAWAQRFKIGERLFSVAYRPKSRAQVVVGGTRQILLLDLDKGRGPALSHQFPASLQKSWSELSMNVDGTRIAARSTDGIIQLWQREGGRVKPMPQWTLQAADAGKFVLSADGQRLVTVGCHGIPTEWVLPPGKAPQNAGPPSAVRQSHCDNDTTTPAVSPDGHFLATSSKNILRVWARREGASGPWVEVASTSLRQRVGDSSIAPDADRISAIAFDPHSRRLAVGSAYGTVRLWNIARGSFPKPYLPVAYSDVGQRVSELAFRGDGTLLTGADDGLITTCSVPGLEKREIYRRHERSITGVAAAGTGDGVLVTSDADGNLLQWIKRNKRVSPFELAARGRAPLKAIALSGDGAFLVTAGDDLLAWDLDRSRMIATAGQYARRSVGDPTADGDEDTGP